MLCYDEKTMTFKREHLTEDECQELRFIAKDIALNGNSNLNHPYVKYWMERSGYDERQQLFVCSTVVPVRFLLSTIT